MLSPLYPEARLSFHQAFRKRRLSLAAFRGFAFRFLFSGDRFTFLQLFLLGIGQSFR